MTVRKCFAFLLTALVLVHSRQGTAGAVELCAALDGSGSVIFSENDFELQLEGLASAVEDPSIIPRNGTVAVSVVLFGAWARTEIPATVVGDEDSASALAATIRSIPKPGPEDFDFWHRTNMIAAMEACVSQFSDSLDEWVLDLSTDGFDNTSPLVEVIAAREQAVAAGVDVFNALAVGTADQASLEQLVWPQPASSPPGEGFVITVPDFAAYVDAMRFKVRTEVRLNVFLDLKPTSCPNSFNRGQRGVLPAAILGSPDFDVLQIDPATLRLEGVAPVSWSYEDVAAPFVPGGSRESCRDCSGEGPDGWTDLTVHFDAYEIAEVLQEQRAGDCVILELAGALGAEYGSRVISGSDLLKVVR